MKRLKHTTKRLAATTLALGLALPASAQVVDVEAGGTRVQVGGGAGVQVDTQDPTAVDSPAVRVDATAASSRLSSTAMVDWLLIDQQSVQQLAQFGLTRSKTPEVRQLAETVARDHAAFARRLQQLVANRPAANGSPEAVQRAEVNAERRQTIRDQREETRDVIRDRREQIGDARRAADGVIRPLERLADRVEDGVERVAEGAQNAAEATREAIDANLGDERVARQSRMQPATNASVQLHREIAERTARIARMDLEQRDGYEFNAAFVGMIEAAHLQQQATFEVMAQHADGELRTVLQDALVTIKQHRQSAGQVMQNLKP